MRAPITWLALLMCFALGGCAESRPVPEGYTVEQATKKVVLIKARQDPAVETYQFIIVRDPVFTKHADVKRVSGSAARAWGTRRASETDRNVTKWVNAAYAQDHSWINVMTVEIAIDTRVDGSDRLSTPAALEKLSQSLADFWTKFPDPTLLPKNEYGASQFSLGSYSTGWDFVGEVTVYEYGTSFGATTYTDQVVRLWQAAEGTPYSDAKSAIARVWVFADAEEPSNVGERLKKIQKTVGPKTRLINLTGVEP